MVIKTAKYGLFATKKPIPLQQIDCTVTAGELISEVLIKQIYEMDVDRATTTEETEEESKEGHGGVEVNFHFPLENRATVHAFHVDIDHLKQEDGQWHHYDTIRGKVKPKQEAREEYEDAIVEGRSSGFLMEKKAHSNDFQVTFMVRDPPREDNVIRQRLTIHLNYVAELDLTISNGAMEGEEQQTTEKEEEQSPMSQPSSLDDVWCRLMLPLTMYPKYEMLAVDQTPATAEDDATEAEPRPEISYAKASNVPYRFGITVQFADKTDVTNVHSPSHQVQISDDRRQVTLRDNKTVPVDRDFRLYFRTRQLVSSLEQSNSLLEEDKKLKKEKEGEKETAVIEEILETELQQNNPKEKYAVMLPIVAPTLLEDHEGTEWYNSELVFVVDCSGSMGGTPIHEAGRTLKLFLQSLPLDQGIRINVLEFGSTYRTLFKESELLTVKTLRKAMTLAEKLNANLGGTELFQPLRYLLEGKSPEGYSRQLFLLTDGEIYNTEETINIVRENRSNVRLYTFGIGNCDHKLVQGLADAGNGFAEFITYGEKIDAKVMGQLKRALRPTWVNCSVEWGKGLSVSPCFYTVQPLYYGTRHLLFAFLESLPKDSFDLKFTAETGRRQDKKFVKTFTLDPNNVQQGKTIHILGAASVVKQMEEFGKPEVYGLKTKEEVKEHIKQLSVRYQILSSECSFVAVSDKVAESEAQQKPLDSVVVPSAVGEMESYSMSPPMPLLASVPMVQKKMKRKKAAFPGVSRIGALFSKSQVSQHKKMTTPSSSIGLSAPPPPPPAGALPPPAPAPFLSAPPPPAPSRNRRRELSGPRNILVDAANEEEEEDYSDEDDDGGFDDEMEVMEAPVVEKEKSMSSSSSLLKIDAVLFSLDPVGSWEWKDAQSYLSSLLGKNEASAKEQELKSAKKEMSIKDDKCLATAVVLILLEIHFSGDKVTWELISKKARGWLKRQVGKQQQPLLQKVRSILS